ncbi:hypothetical protein CA13_44630 [Planctomycetes bacterium CA13]|uniref:Uncharacterized protein n=1 Tax=Novipirellula herctigrandis TaxID=2527986 RepID=A0A5C5Z731_9BACT|nr:hypothetical protein CA13_44630 [Planctomycetes bacterium CA13]
MTRFPVTVAFTLLLTFGLLTDAAYAESELVSLIGFDLSRIEKTFPVRNEDSVGEAAKLLYRLNRMTSEKLSEIAAKDKQPNAPTLGDCSIVEGTVQGIKPFAIPEKLIEFLELRQVLQVTVQREEAASTVTLLTTELPRDITIGDRIRGIGMVIETSEEDVVSAVASVPVQWFPAKPKNEGWKLLSSKGVDVGQLGSVALRNRQPLSGEDTEIFYAMLAASAEVGRTPKNELPTPARIKPVDLLKDPMAFTGDFVQIKVETIQVTRIAVTEPARQKQLGSDHYFQIDAIGDLGNVVVEIAPPPGSDGQPAKFQNRYPISIVSRTLPAWMQQRIKATKQTDAVVTPIVVPVAVDGFFFRLWSYSSEYMRQFGGGDQFGPLLIAADLNNREPTNPDPAGVKMIGWIAAIATCASIVGLFIWSLIVARRDRRIERVRKEREAEQMQLPESM